MVLHTSCKYTLADLAQSQSLTFEGDGDHVVEGVATIEQATSKQIAFLANVQYRQYLEESKAGVLIVSKDDAHLWDGFKILSDNPYLTYALIAQMLYPPNPIINELHETAIIHPSVQLGQNVSIGEYVVVGENTNIEDNVSIGAHCVLGSSCVVRENTRLCANVTLYDNVEIGARGLIHSGAVLGSDGFGFAYNQGTWEKVPQLGRVIIGDDVEIGSNTAVDRGALSDTIIENGVKLDNQIQIAHNVHIGAHTVVAGGVGIAGSTRLGKQCRIGGKAGIIGHLDIVDGVTVTAMSLVTKSIKNPGSYSSAFSAISSNQWNRLVGWLKRSVPQKESEL